MIVFNQSGSVIIIIIIIQVLVIPAQLLLLLLSVKPAYKYTTLLFVFPRSPSVFFSIPRKSGKNGEYYLDKTIEVS
jgi:hypothetical protein